MPFIDKFSMVAVAIVGIAGCTTTYKKQGATQSTTLDDAKFEYNILTADSDQKRRRLELRHLQSQYTGKLADLEFTDRHLKVMDLAGNLVGKSCANGVVGLGKIVLSKDPEVDSDPKNEHPQYFIWEFQCK